MSVLKYRSFVVPIPLDGCTVKVLPSVDSLQLRYEVPDWPGYCLQVIEYVSPAFTVSIRSITIYCPLDEKLAPLPFGAPSTNGPLEKAAFSVRMDPKPATVREIFPGPHCAETEDSKKKTKKTTGNPSIALLNFNILQVVYVVPLTAVRYLYSLNGKMVASLQ